jgi:GT2 family glycosyltransferase
MSLRVSAIIVNYMTPDLTARAVESLLGEPQLEEVIVVDNGSSDSSTQALTELLAGVAVKVVQSRDNLGFGGGVNLGAGQASGEALLVMNSDATLAKGSLSILARDLGSDSRLAISAPSLENLPASIVARGKLQPDAYGDFPSLRTMLLRSNRHPKPTLEPDWVSAAAMLVRRTAFEEVGGFDPEFRMYLEDVDLCQRLRGRGWKIRRAPQATVTHRSGASSVPRDREQMYHESLKLYFRKHGASSLEVHLLGSAHGVWSRLRRMVPNPNRTHR